MNYKELGYKTPLNLTEVRLIGHYLVYFNSDGLISAKLTWQ